MVRTSYDEAIHVTFWFSVIMAACAMISAIFIKEKPIPAKTT